MKSRPSPCPGLLCALILWTALLNASPAAARVVEVPIETSNATGQAGLTPLERAFTLAVFQEALALLPTPLSEPRQVLLEDLLARSGRGLVVSYTELYASSTAAGKTLTYDINVNQSALKQTLQALGLMHTTGAPLLYHLELGDAPAGTWETLGRLQLLGGMETRAGAWPRLYLSYGGGQWRGRLDTGQQSFSLEQAGLEDLWISLWGRYFALPAVGSQGMSVALLTVEGWTIPQEVEEFDRLLRGWSAEVQSAEIRDVILKPTGIAARWLITVLKRQTLEQRLNGYFSGRNLTYALSEPPAAP